MAINFCQLVLFRRTRSPVDRSTQPSVPPFLAPHTVQTNGRSPRHRYFATLRPRPTGQGNSAGPGIPKRERSVGREIGFNFKITMSMD